MARRKRPTFVDEEDVRAGLEAELLQDVNQDIWADMMADGLIGRVLVGDMTIEALAESYRRKERMYGRKPNGSGEKAPRVIPPDNRSYALADILAIDAGRLEEVVAFRRDALGGKLMSPDQVAEWIESTAKKDGAPTLWVRVPLPDDAAEAAGSFTGDEIAAILRAAADAYEGRRLVSAGYELDSLSYAVPGDEWTHAVPIRRDGVLGRLKRVASTLVKRYPWTEAQAVLFVLTGAVPALPKARVTRSMWELQWPRSYPALRRVTLDVDLRLAPREVADIYAKVRAKHLKARDKPMGEKHLALAVFAHRHRDDLTWEEMLSRWNREHPEWAYPEDALRNFHRDAVLAWERVTGAEWPRKTAPKEE